MGAVELGIPLGGWLADADRANCRASTWGGVLFVRHLPGDGRVRCLPRTARWPEPVSCREAAHALITPVSASGRRAGLGPEPRAGRAAQRRSALARVTWASKSRAAPAGGRRPPVQMARSERCRLMPAIGTAVSRCAVRSSATASSLSTAGPARRARQRGPPSWTTARVRPASIPSSAGLPRWRW